MSVGALVAAYDHLGQALYSRLAETPGNIVLSPLSIGTALAMALSGARGDTEAEMARVLGQGLPINEIEAASRALIRMLESYAGEDATHIAIANALLLDSRFGELILPSYRQRLAASFEAEIRTGATAEEINAWVDSRTMGLVPRIVDAVHPEAAGTILNAVAFAANWAFPFDSEDTAIGPFTLSTGEAAEVPMMRRRMHASLAEDCDSRAVRLPFSRSNLNLVCVLPKPAVGLASFERSDAMVRARGPQKYVDLTIPKFCVDARLDLVPSLAGLGLEIAFTDQADFSGIALENPGVKIAQILHGACLEIHEMGCAAAAATAVGVAAAGIAPKQLEPEVFTVDRPFAFALVDDLSGATLMRGRVVDPRG